LLARRDESRWKCLGPLQGIWQRGPWDKAGAQNEMVKTKPEQGVGAADESLSVALRLGAANAAA
jgi:hypothetical protein